MRHRKNKGGVRDVDNIVEGTARRQGANSSKPEGEKFLLRQAAKPSETSKTFRVMIYANFTGRVAKKAKVIDGVNGQFLFPGRTLKVVTILQKFGK